MLLYLVIFIFSCLLLILAGNWLVNSLGRISSFLGLKKFVVAFLLMSIATALPELFVGISSALRGVSELSLGNIIGQNIIHFTLAIFVCVVIAGAFSVRSKTVKTTAFFAGFMALFPLILILDGTLSRSDGLILLGLFTVYITRMLWNGKKHNHNEDYGGVAEARDLSSLGEKIRKFFGEIWHFVLGAVLLIVAAQGIVKSAIFFAESLDTPLILVGVLIVGLGTALPEVIFSAFSAKMGDGELMSGNLLGSTVVSTSLVLGITSIISPITGIAFLSYFFSRLILFVSVAFFIYFMLTDRKISIKEATVLLFIYLFFVLLEVFL